MLREEGDSSGGCERSEEQSSGKLTLNEVPYKQKDFEKAIDTVIRPLMEERKIQFIFRIDHPVDAIMVDSLRFNQIFFYLLSNAAKFTPQGGRVEFICEKMEPKNNQVGIRARVKDNGIGMGEEFQKHMYDPFAQESLQMGGQATGNRAWTADCKKSCGYDGRNDFG